MLAIVNINTSMGAPKEFKIWALTLERKAKVRQIVKGRYRYENNL